MFTCGAKMIASLAQHRLILFPYIHVMCSGVLHVFISVYYLDCTEFTITKIMFRKMKRWKKKMWRLTRKMQKQTVLVVMFAFRSTVLEFIFNVYCRIPILRKYMYVFLQFCGFVSNWKNVES